MSDLVSKVCRDGTCIAEIPPNHHEMRQSVLDETLFEHLQEVSFPRLPADD